MTGQSRPARKTRAAFGPSWLAAQLARLLPGYPRVSLCVAWSGGMDSSALLAALTQRPRAWPKVRAVYVDHGLHADARRWGEQCRSLARSAGIRFQVVKVNARGAPGDSLEAAARDARYAALAALLQEGEVLLTGQHQDDQLESVLLQLFRGSGLAGIAAMPALAALGCGWLCRPLLQTTRTELHAWATQVGLRWIEDDSNANESFDRNYLRRQVLPLVRKRWPAVCASVARSARHAAEGRRLLDDLGRQDVERAADGESLRVAPLRALTQDRRRNALRYWIVSCGVRAPDTRRLDQIAGAVLEARSDAHPRVRWGRHCVEREAGRITLRRDPERGAAAGAVAVGPPAAVRAAAAVSPAVDNSQQDGAPADPPIRWRWEKAGTLELPRGRGKLELRGDPHGPVDLGALPAALHVSRRRGGERLRLTAHGPSRALKNLLQEAQIPISERRELPLIFAGRRLLAVADLWCDASVRAHAQCSRRGRFFWHRDRQS